MQTDVFLIGGGQTRFGEWWDRSVSDLMSEAVDRAMESAPCTALDIDFVVVSNMLAEATSGQAHLGAIGSSLLPHRPPSLRVEAACASGSVALHTACALLESGRAETVLVIGAEKMTDTPADEIATALMGAADSERDTQSGLTFPGIFGLVAQRYMHEFGLTREDLNLVSAHHHRQAVKNPFAQFRQEISPEAIGASSLVSDPLRLLDCSPISDGAAAAILSTKFVSPLKLVASQISTDTLSLTERDSIVSFPAIKDAAQRAFDEASVAPGDISHLELHDCFSIAALLSLEDLGFADPGTAINLYRKEQSFTFNQSGGLKACGHPVGATGVKQFIDIGKQLKSSGAHYGLAHNFGGAGATCGIHILENQ